MSSGRRNISAWDNFIKYHEKEIEYCNNILQKDQKEICIKLNKNFYNLIKEIYDDLSSYQENTEHNNKKIAFQTTPIIGFSRSAYKTGGYVIIGYNEHEGEDKNDENKNKNESVEKCPTENEGRNFTGVTRDNLLNCYQYYTFFTKEMDLGENAKFMELIPIRSKGAKELKDILKLLKVKDEKYNLEIEGNVFVQFLLDLLNEIKPELIICNSVKSSEIFEKMGEQIINEIDTNVRYWNNIPVILSGQITGNRRPDNYNLRRIIKQMREEMEKIRIKRIKSLNSGGKENER